MVSELEIETQEIDTSGKKNTSAGISIQSITPSSPYYLGASDNPGTPLVTVPLTGDNYRNWARSMRTALRAKTKLGFIDGTIKKPPPRSADLFHWEKADSMVTAWIINSTDPSLHGSISHVTTARDVWVDLEERFAQTNAPRIHQIWRNLCLIQQEPNMTVTEFYTKFKSLLDELAELHPLPECTCGASKELAQREEEQRVHLFLGGIDNDRYHHVKGTLLSADPLLPLRKAFNHILREESRVLAEKDKDPKPETATSFHVANFNRRKGRDGPRPKCDHCGKIGHEKAKCFELVGYPPNWESRRPKSKYSGGARLAWAGYNHDHAASVEGGTSNHAKKNDHFDHMSVYVLRVANQGSSLAATPQDASVLWHARMGHPSNKDCPMQHVSTSDEPTMSSSPFAQHDFVRHEADLMVTSPCHAMTHAPSLGQDAYDNFHEHVMTETRPLDQQPHVMQELSKAASSTRMPSTSPSTSRTISPAGDASLQSDGPN
ncbi:Gag-polypeptide of LTR copia-type [Sesbania bispinosa]|nr:Gag-polypeptide of LTR copia-type [Sesbania bispinosa]